MGDDITIGVTEIVNNIEVTAQPNDQIVDINVTDNSENVTLNITPTVIEINVNKGSSYARWGSILGTLTDQTDLANALILKADLIDGLVPSYQLPSYVDDVIEVANYAALPASGETGKIYITLDTNHIYRWSGSTYIEITDNTAVWGAITGTLSSQTDLVNALNLRVPYTGATSNVNLGEYGLTGGFLALDTTPTSTPTGIGTIYWDSANRTAALIDGDGDTTLQIGQEQRILVHNNTGSTLTDGQVVYVTGSTGNLPSVSLANASSETTSAATLGVVTESIAHGADGFITTSGIVNGLNTLAFNEGDLLWLGTTAGTFTATKPISPNHLVLIGYVIKKAGGNGSILVKIQNTQELKESSDVLFTSLTNNDILTYESSTDLWKNKSIATILGYTPANDSSVVHLAGTETITGIKTFSNATKFDFGTYLKQDTTTSYYTGYTTIDGFANGFTINNGDTRAAIFTLANNASRNYTFPDANGTFALTSDLASYVPTTRTLTINGTSYDLTANRSWTITAGVWGQITGTLSNQTDLQAALDAKVQSVAANAPLGSTGGTSPVISITQATTSSNGYLSSTDWNTFNNKVPTSRTLTINGTSYDLSADRSWTISAGISGSGTTGKIPLFTSSTALGDSSLTEFSTYLNLTKPLTIAYSTATSASGLNLSLNNAGSTGTTLYVFNAGTGNLAQFQKSNNTAAFLINSSGNVGIGTTSPAALLHLATSSGNGSAMRFESTSTNGRIYGIGSNFATGNGEFAIYDYTANAERMRITSGGDVFIGSTSAANVEKLGVTYNSQDRLGFVLNDTYTGGATSQIAVQFRRNGSAIGSITTTTSTTSYNIMSDYRLKEDFKDYSGLDLISKIKTYDYKWKQSEDRMYGVKAHELQEVVPYAVTGKKDAEQMQSVDYSKLVPILVQAIQELNDKINKLENK